MLPIRPLARTLKGVDQKARVHHYEQQARDAHPNERVATQLRAPFLVDRLGALRTFDLYAVTTHRRA